MKRIIDADEDSGLAAMLGEKVILLCANYFYAGTLSGVGTDHVELADASIVYETGSWLDTVWKDAQQLPGKVWHVQIAAIESYGAGK